MFEPLLFLLLKDQVCVLFVVGIFNVEIQDKVDVIIRP